MAIIYENKVKELGKDIMMIEWRRLHLLFWRQRSGKLQRLLLLC
ncbi:MAG: hypothetical protein ACLTEE_16125 [Anaerobutyricum hallii]